MNKTMTLDEREAILAEAIQSEEGRIALAESMANPIQTSLLYQSIGRKLLLVDPLPQGALARYEKDIEAPATLISKRGEVPVQIIEGEDFLVPTFELASRPTVRLSQVKQRMFSLN